MQPVQPSLQPPALPSSRWHVGVLLFPNVELLDFCGPLEVFTLAGRLVDETDSAASLQAFTISVEKSPVVTRAGLQVLPDYRLDEHPPLEILVVPGGIGTRHAAENERLIEWIASAMSTTQITASVCTGAFLLARTGLLGKREVTTHWASLDRLAREYPELIVLRDVRFVDAGNIVTSAGISAGIDMSLHLVARLFGDELARQTAHQMEYQWLEGTAGSVK
jgi:transcriptional regulator GlxA family with amidase domain